jgi:hypothetical protein
VMVFTSRGTELALWLFENSSVRIHRVSYKSTKKAMEKGTVSAGLAWQHLAYCSKSSFAECVKNVSNWKTGQDARSTESPSGAQSNPMAFT